MKALQDELDTIEVEGVAGGGVVAVTLSGKGDMKGVRIDHSLMQAGRKGNSRGSSGRRSCRRAQEVGKRDAGKDESN